MLNNLSFISSINKVSVLPFISLNSNLSSVDLEPNINTWDFVFTKYVAEVAAGVFYPVTGVLHNFNTLSVKVANVDIASVDAGASAASYGEPALLPL